MSCLKLNGWKSIFPVRSASKSKHQDMEKSTSQPAIYKAQVIDDSDSSTSYHRSVSNKSVIPDSQSRLLLRAAKEEYQLVSDGKIPTADSEDEAIIQIQTIGLNPIDWKGPAYNFGLPSFPCVLGRDYVGTVVKAPKKASRIKLGDIVLGISTDYRDYRKAAFQQYAIASDSNLSRVPVSSAKDKVASIGVAFVTSALLLGICLGLKFPDGPDILSQVRARDIDSLPEDIREECHLLLLQEERLKAGDWLAIWGAGSTVGFLTLQLAKLAGVRVIAVADAIKRGGLLHDAGAEVLVHREHTEEASAIVRSVSKNQVRYGVDTVGKDSAQVLQSVLSGTSSRRAHIVGLTGLPKEGQVDVIQHKVPIKLFHEIPQIGEAIMVWLEELLANGKLILPEVDIHPTTGLGVVNEALGRLSSGSLRSQRIVVNV